MNRAFSKIWITVIVFVFIACGILAWQYFGVPKEEVKAPEEVVKDETADWKTYRNEEYGFEIKYPANWSYGPMAYGTGPELVFCPPEFTDYDPNGEGCKWEPTGDRGRVDTQSPIRLFSWTLEFGPEATADKNVWKSPKGRVYDLNLFDDSFQDIYNQMLSTFRFLE